MVFLLDSHSYLNGHINRDIRPTRDRSPDNLNIYEHEDTMVDSSLNKFNILLHSSKEFPMFMGPKKNSFTLNSKEWLSLRTLRQYSLAFDVKQRILDQDLVDLFPKDKRQCKFPSEADLLGYSDNYTQAHCIYECKLEVIADTCGCLPWFVPFRSENLTTCNIFGNKCYEQILLTSNEKLDFSNLNTPVCDCLPDCESTEYIPVISNEERIIQDGENEFYLDTREIDGIPNDWNDDEWVREYNKDKFLFAYVRDSTLGKLSNVVNFSYFIF